MTHKLVSQLDEQGFFVGMVVADESPLEPGVYLIPAGAVEAEEPQTVEGKRARWEGVWVYEVIPEPPKEPEPAPPTEEELKVNRINELKWQLTETDYVALADYDKEKPELLLQRQEWRNEIRRLENE